MQEKLAVCSVITEDFVEYLKVFCQSLLDNCSNFTRDYLVFYYKDTLKEDDFAALRRIYKNFVFKEINEKNYDVLIDESYKENIPRQTLIKRFAYARLEMFNQEGYDQIIYFDVDMIVKKNLNSLLNIRYPDGILACEDIMVKKYKLACPDIYKKDHFVQGGLIVVGKKMINKETYQDLVNLLPRASEFRLNDQSMFVYYFGKKNKIKSLDYLFNCPRKLIRNKDVNLKDVYIIHFSGSTKPYDIKSKRLNYGCYTFKYWHKFKRKIDGQNILLIFIKNIFYIKGFSYLRSKVLNN